MRNWLRDNYGWRAKKGDWASVAFGLLLAVAVIAVLVAQ